MGGVFDVGGSLRIAGIVCWMGSLYGGKRNAVLGLYKFMVWMGKYQWIRMSGKRCGIWDCCATFDVLFSAILCMVGKEDDAKIIFDFGNYVVRVSDSGRCSKPDVEKSGIADGAEFL